MTTSIFRIELSDVSICVGDEFLAHVYVDSPEETINAVQGMLIYRSSDITPISIQYGDSFLRYWVTPPALPVISGEIGFTGGLPHPGFTGTNGKVMSIVFRADLNSADTTISISRDAKALLNDGRGTKTDILYNDANLKILSADSVECKTESSEKIIITDAIPPEEFRVVITREEEIFGGAYFAAYETTDLDTGVAYYDVRETSQFIITSWQRTASPYKLNTQGGDVLIEVRAIDGAGNIRLSSKSATLEPQTKGLVFSDTLILVFAVIVVAIIAIEFFRRKKKEE